MNNNILKIGNVSISPDKYQKWLKNLTNWFNNSGRAEETLERHLDNIQRLYNEGGILYRLMFLESGETIDKNNLGQHWVADENVLADIRSMLLDTAKAEKDPEYEYTITIKTPPKNINIQDSISNFLENPNEEEIYLDNTKSVKIQDIQKIPLAEMIIRRRLAKLTESFDFISGVDTVNMKEYAKAAIRDIFIQMPSRSVNLNNWYGYKNYVEGFFGKDSYRVAMKELKKDGWLTKGETRYEWKKMFGPVGTIPEKAHLNEWADAIHLKGKHTVLDYTDVGAYPFIFHIKENKAYIGEEGEAHLDSMDTDIYWKNQGAIAGRIWWRQKIISFWEYPDNVAMYKNLIVQLNKAIDKKNEMGDNIKKVTPAWKLDVPNTEVDLTTTDKFSDKMHNVEEEEDVKLFRDIKSTLIPIFDWTPKLMKNAKIFIQQMEKKRQTHMLSPIAKDVSSEKGIGSRKTPAGMSATQRHQIQSTSEQTMNEHPDRIDTKGVYVRYGDYDAFSFGYYMGLLYVSDDTHRKIWARTNSGNIETGIPRKNFRYGGRIWMENNIISFWEYPEDSNKMKQICVELSEWFKYGWENQQNNVDKKSINRFLGKDYNIWNTFRVEIIVNAGGTIETDVEYDGFNKIENVENHEIKIIPVKDYQSSEERSSEELVLQHILSPMKKSGQELPSGVGSEKTLAGLTPTQYHQLRTTSESADVFTHPDTGNRIYYDFGGIAFGYIDDKMEISKYNGIHGDIVNGIYNRNGIKYKGNVRDAFEYPGRIWQNDKIISFWFYPKNKEELNKIIRDLEISLKIEIDSKYRIEIREYGEYKFIYIDDYDGSDKISSADLEKGHMLSPAYKTYIDVPPGWGSKKIPSGLSATQMHQMKFTSEIKEWADKLDYIDKSNKKRQLYYTDFDAIPFGYNPDSDRLKIGISGETHSYSNIEAWQYNYVGRIWSDEKVISFWEYPETKSKLNKIIKDLNSKLKKVKINNAWKIDVPNLTKNINSFKILPNQGDIAQGEKVNKIYGVNSTLVPIKDWHPDMISHAKDFKKRIKKQQRMHMLSPVAKSVSGEKGIGSRKTPAGLSSSQRHQMQSTSENKLNEKYIPKLHDVVEIPGEWFMDGNPREGKIILISPDKNRLKISSKKYPTIFWVSTKNIIPSENKLNEMRTEYGCLMLKIDFPWWKNFIEKYIKNEDVYNNPAHDYGREYSTHVTVLYGFNAGIDIKKLEKMINTLKRPISIKLTKIDTFTQKELDVVKFHVESKTLENLNKIMTQNFDYTEIHKEYDAHMTIAYVKPEMGKNYTGNLKMPISVSSSTLIYSYPGGKREVFNFLQKNQTNL